MDKAYIVTITVYKLNENTVSGVTVLCIGRILTYTAVYDPDTNEFISDYVPQPGDYIVVTVTEKDTGKLVKEYSQLFDESYADKSANGISITLTETKTADETGNEIVNIDIDVKADTVDVSLIVSHGIPNTPDEPNTPDLPNTPDTPDKPDSPDVPDKPIKEIMLGDVNGDGKVTAKDSMLIQRYAVNLVTLSDGQLKAADVNSDGKATNKDALEILRYTINLSKNNSIGSAIV